MIKRIASSLICLFFFAALQAQNSESFQQVIFQTNGTCNSCKNKIEYALTYEKGVKKVNYDLATSKVSVTYNEKKTTPQKLQKAIQDLGFKAEIPANHTANTKQGEARKDCCQSHKAAEGGKE